jgi:hypothetical protein
MELTDVLGDVALLRGDLLAAIVGGGVLTSFEQPPCADRGCGRCGTKCQSEDTQP